MRIYSLAAEYARSSTYHAKWGNNDESIFKLSHHHISFLSPLTESITNTIDTLFNLTLSYSLHSFTSQCVLPSPSSSPSLPLRSAPSSYVLFCLSSIFSQRCAQQVTSPTASTTFTGGSQSTVSWIDDGKSPSLTAFGDASLSIYVGNAQQQVSIVFFFGKGLVTSANRDTYYDESITCESAHLCSFL
jgi:hypothetical protein